MNLIDRILVPYDHSKPSANAFSYALDLVESLKNPCRLFELLVVSQPPLGSIENPAADEEVRKAEADFGQLRASAEARGIKIVINEVDGLAGEAIAKRATQGNFNLIVLGHHHHSLLGRLFSPSTAKATIDSATCPTLVVW
jgi:nucleotide-binding universal stress UspA family protein